MSKIVSSERDRSITRKTFAQSSQEVGQLEILLVPQKGSTTADRAKVTLEKNSLRNHLIEFSETFPYGPSEPRYKLRIAAELPGYFHCTEAEQIIEATNIWRWGEPQTLGRLGVLIESAIAQTMQGRQPND